MHDNYLICCLRLLQIREAKDTEKITEREYDFIEDPPNDFFCPVTLDLLLNPHQTTCCGKHLSDKAVTRIQKEQRACPLCKKQSLVAHPDIHFRRQVHELRVFCNHKERGCGWKGELSALEHHVESCPWKNSPILSTTLCEYLIIFP